MGHQAVGLLLVQHVSHQGPVGADALGLTEATVGIFVIEEAGLFIPQMLADVAGEHLHLIFQCSK